ncbi:MAG TPA: flagellar biosynthetic protein FliO [Oryzihumus sp.]|nr:flagellar biosynthetic protein FliO [Oryzihumus sp.]
MSDGSAVATLVRLAFSLALVLGLMVLAARLLRRRQLGLGGVRPRPQLPLQVLARHGLSRTASVSVVQVGEHVLVLGVTESSVEVLRELDPAELSYAAPEPALPGLTSGLTSTLQAGLVSGLVSGLRQRRPVAGETVDGGAGEGPRSQWSAPGLDFGVLLESLREKTTRRG